MSNIISVNILAGKSSGKPTHGCPYCSASTPYKDDGVLYDKAQLMKLHEVINCNIKVKLRTQTNNIFDN